MKTLNELFIEKGTDKGSTHEYCPHNYAAHYERFFEPLRFSPLRFLEIGCGGGQSMQAWLAYFESPEARIFGADIVHDTNPWNSTVATPDPRYCFIHLDQENEQNLDCFVAMTHSYFDVVIDDGAHSNTGIIRTFNKLWPDLRPGGLYCIEDLNSGYTPGSVFIKPGAPDHKAWLHALTDRMVTGPAELDFVYFGHELAILKKKS